MAAAMSPPVPPLAPAVYAPSKIVICGAGLHGAALAYYLTRAGHPDVTLVERAGVAAAASGKGGGFLARDWGSGPTVELHRLSFAMHAELAAELGLKSYRRIPVLQVEPGKRPKAARRRGNAGAASGMEALCPWLDGEVASAALMDADGGAQVPPLVRMKHVFVEGVRRGGDGERGGHCVCACG
jgi:glycine/D-amino acid oxidase-like deaminating enzyme